MEDKFIKERTDILGHSKAEFVGIKVCHIAIFEKCIYTLILIPINEILICSSGHDQNGV